MIPVPTGATGLRSLEVAIPCAADPADEPMAAGFCLLVRSASLGGSAASPLTGPASPLGTGATHPARRAGAAQELPPARLNWVPGTARSARGSGRPR